MTYSTFLDQWDEVVAETRPALQREDERSQQLLAVAESKRPDFDESPVALAIMFDTDGFKTEAQMIAWARYLIRTGMVNSTGSYQRFVHDLLRQGYDLT